MVREDIVAVDPVSRLLADNIEESVLAPFKAEFCVEVWEDELVSREGHLAELLRR